MKNLFTSTSSQETYTKESLSRGSVTWVYQLGAEKCKEIFGKGFPDLKAPLHKKLLLRNKKTGEILRKHNKWELDFEGKFDLNYWKADMAEVEFEVLVDLNHPSLLEKLQQNKQAKYVPTKRELRKLTSIGTGISDKDNTPVIKWNDKGIEAANKRATFNYATKKEYMLLDYDGCFGALEHLSKLKSQEFVNKLEENFIVEFKELEIAHRKLLQEIKENKREVIIGSNRQDRSMELDNAVRHLKKEYNKLENKLESYYVNSCFLTFEQLKKEKDFNFNPILLSDIVLGRKPGSTYNETLEFLKKHLFDEKGNLASIFSVETLNAIEDYKKQDEGNYVGSTKILLLWSLIQHLANENPDKMLEIEFLDDRYDILAALQTTFSTFPDLVPHNVKLTLVEYSTETKFEKKLFKDGIIYGSGKIGSEYTSIKKIVEEVSSDIGEKQKKKAVDALEQYLYETATHKKSLDQYQEYESKIQEAMIEGLKAFDNEKYKQYSKEVSELKQQLTDLKWDDANKKYEDILSSYEKAKSIFSKLLKEDPISKFCKSSQDTIEELKNKQGSIKKIEKVKGMKDFDSIFELLGIRAGEDLQNDEEIEDSEIDTFDFDSENEKKETEMNENEKSNVNERTLSISSRRKISLASMKEELNDNSEIDNNKNKKNSQPKF
jgi:hypothetical protein